MSEKATKAVLRSLGGDFTHIKDGGDHFIGHEENDAFGHKITSGEGGEIITQGVNNSSTGDEYDSPVTHKNAEAAANYIKRSYLGEETLAADTIAPKGDAKEVTPSKLGMMATVMNAMSGMSAEDLNGFMASMAQYGAGRDWGVPTGTAEHNQSTIVAKPSAATVREDLDVMFNGTDLSEEFKDKAGTLFEAAIEARLATEKVRLEEDYAATIKEQMETFSEDLTNKLDSYLDHVVESWMSENQVAIESTLQTELTQDFIEGLKNLFAEHYIDVPADKVDVLESLAEKVGVLESKLDEVLVENNELRDALTEEKAVNIIEELSSDLALTQKDKFLKIAEGIEFNGDLDVFAEKLSTIKESYFGNGQSQESNILEESFEGDTQDTTTYVDSGVNRYVEAIAKSIKK